MLGQIDLLGESKLSLSQGTVEVDILNLVAKIDFAVQNGDQAILDDQQYGSALLDILQQGPVGLDGKSAATAITSVDIQQSMQHACFVALTVEAGWGSDRRYRCVECQTPVPNSTSKDYLRGQTSESHRL